MDDNCPAAIYGDASMKEAMAKCLQGVNLSDEARGLIGSAIPDKARLECSREVIKFAI